MPILQSRWIKREENTLRPQTAGASHVTHFIYDFGAADSKAAAANDIIELGILPGYATIHAMTLVVEGAFAATTADIGIMTGDVGEPLNADGTARTVGTQGFAAADLTNTFQSLSKGDLLLLPQARS